MDINLIEKRRLINNNITSFILRIDISNEFDCKIDEIAKGISDHFHRTERKPKKSITFMVKKEKLGSNDFEEIEDEDIVLINEETNLKLTLIPEKIQSSIVFESKKYTDSSLYRNTLDSLIACFREKKSEIKSKRIGIRFINEFPCNNINNIKKIFDSKLANNLIGSVKKEKISRILTQEAFNYETYKITFHYGIHNKFYPSILKSYDLFIDTDVYDDSSNDLDSWSEIVDKLNHIAYDKFRESINNGYIEKMY
jgi:uncharacterized protein (TIGR04255 family)